MENRVMDTIANNLANVNTTGYKTQVNEFKSLLYQNIQTKTTSANGDTKPSSAQVGLGVRNASISSVFKEGNRLHPTVIQHLLLTERDFSQCAVQTATLTIRETVI